MKTITQSRATGARRWLLYMLVVMVAWGAKVNAQTTYTVGTGTSSSSYLPIYSCYGYNYSQVIYLASEINAAGLTGPSFITKIRYYSVSPVSNTTWNQWDVYMGNTSNSSFASTSAWIPVANLTQVYSGTITQPVGGQWMEITLANPFFWDGSSNIVVGVDENVPSYTCTATWQVTTGSGTRSILFYNDVTNPNPTAPPTANYSTTQYANIQFYAAPAPACSGAPTGGTAAATPAAPCFNATAALAVNGATLATGLTYQWQSYNGTVWNDIAGATSATYTTPPVNATPAQYRRKIRCGTTDSSYSTSVTVSASIAGPPYTETFESITANNTLPTCMTATNLGSYTYTYTTPNSTYNQLNHTPGGSKYASFRYGCNDYFFTPAQQLVAGQLYQFSYWYIKDQYTGWNTLQAAYGTSPTSGAQTNVIGTISSPSNTTYQQAIYQFTPTTSGIYYFSIYCQSNFTPWYLTIDDINLVALPPCSGTPTAGSVTPAGPVSGCPGTQYAFSTTGTTTAANLTYQWLQSTNAAPAWAPAVGTGANSLFFTTPNLTDTIRYRMVVTCTNSGLRDSSTIVTVNVPKVPYAAIPYTEDFENWSSRCSTTDIPSASWTNVPYTGDNSWRRNDQGSSASWTSPTYTFNPPLSAVGNYSARWHGYYAPTGNPGGIMDLFVNCSSVTGNKELQFYYNTQTGTPYPNDSLLVYMSTNGGGTFSLLGAYGPTTGSWQLKVIPLISNSATTVIRFRAKDDYQYYGDIGLDYVRILPPCSGHPTAGTVKPVTPCPNADFPLSLLGSSQAAGLTYQWQSSTNGSTWSAAGITNATQAIATGNIAAPTWFRCIVTCTNSSTNNVDTTPAYQVQLAPFYVCYCQSTSNPTYYNYGNVGNFKVTTQPANVTLLNNGTASPLTYNTTAIQNYTSFTNLPAVPMYQDSLYKFFVTEISQTYFVTGTNYGAVYLDYDRNGSFDPYERILYQNIGSNSSTQQVSDTFRIPDTASVGLTGLRVIVYPYYNTINPCGTYYYGETEDYLANIKYPPCDGPTNAGVAFTSDTAMCPGYSFLLTDTTHEYHRSGIVWNWQLSTNSGGSWSDIAGSSGKDTLSQIFSSTAWYRLKMVCTFTGDSTYSNSVKITIKPPYKCYCYSIAVGGVQNDTSDIGAMSIGNFIVNSGGPHLRNPVARRGRTDYTDLGPVELYADTTYEVDVYHTMPNGNHADARVTLFMDFNNNLQYDIPQERVDIMPTSTTNWMSTVNDWYLVNHITIPTAVIPDVPTGMRVIINNNVGPNTQSDDACGAYTSGETEDYVVVFRKGWKTSVGEIANLKDLALFPNPTSGRFSISFNATTTVNNLQISITNITGQQIMQQEYKNVGHSFVKELDLSTAARGVYFVEIKADGEKTIRKIVVR